MKGLRFMTFDGVPKKKRKPHMYVTSTFLRKISSARWHLFQDRSHELGLKRNTQLHRDRVTGQPLMWEIVG